MTSFSPSRLLVVLALLLGLIAPTLAAGPVSAKPGPKGPRTYVALGDSYAAGPLIPVQKQPWGCLTSTNNYAELLAERYGFELRDATCSGAQTDDMTEEQGVSPEPNPPQFDRLDETVDLVTLQIGGNDIGFGGIAETCARAGFERVSCKSKYVHDGRDELRERIARTGPDVGAVIQGIHALAPEAKVLVLGYPGIFKFGPTADCPAMLVGADDALYLRGIQEALNAMIAEQAALNGATYVDVYAASEGKTACDLPVLRWVEPIVPVNAAAPVHPNLMGMIGMTDVIEADFPKKWMPVAGALPINPALG